MKFIETFCGDCINLDDVSYFYVEEDKKGKLFSFIVMKNGKEFELMEVPDNFIYEEKEIKFNLDHLHTLQKYFINLCLEFPYPFVFLDDTTDKAWKLFMNDWKNLQKKQLKNLKK